MNSNEIKIQLDRVERYKELERQSQQLDHAISIIGKNNSAFTGNARESRHVESIKINFSPTRGGAPAVDEFLPNVKISAYELGKVLREMFQERLNEVNKAMKAI